MIKGHVVEQVKPMKRLEHMRLDEELAFKLQAKEEEKERLAREKAQQIEEASISWDDVTKKQKVDDVQETVEVDNDQEAAKIKELMEIVPNKEEVAIDAIHLAVKPPSIMYLVFSHMLKSFNMEDLETLWKLVKVKHGSTRPEEGYERVLWDDLKGRIVGIKRLLDDLRVTADQVFVTASKLNYYCSKIKTAERVSTVRERIKTEERIKIVWRSRLLT
ncbi:reverse transcriptase domain-containing protein [Tanacetum coccineum]